MLSKALMGSLLSSGPITLVGSKVANFNGSGYASSSISLSDLSIQTNDLILFCTSTRSSVSIGMSATGYTNIHASYLAELYVSNFYKVATSLESRINFEWFPGTGSNISAVVAVFRNVEYDSQDFSTSESQEADPPSISCSVGDLILASYHFRGGTLSSIEIPTGYTLVNKRTSGTQSSVNLFYKIATSTTEDPSALTRGDSGNSAFGGTIRCTPI
jgi:hypothetical protein